MPRIKSAKKKLRQDIKRTKSNKTYLTAVKKILKLVLKLKPGTKSDKNLKKAYSLIDKAVRKKVIHKNKAARLKSRVTRFTNKK